MCYGHLAPGVDATHDFRSPDDRRDIEKEVVGFLPGAPLWVAVDSQDRAVAFMLLGVTIWRRCLLILRIEDPVWGVPLSDTR